MYKCRLLLQRSDFTTYSSENRERSLKKTELAKQDKTLGNFLTCSPLCFHYLFTWGPKQGYTNFFNL